MKTHALDFSAIKAAQSITLKVRVRGMRTLKFRCWLGAKLMGLSARVMGLPVEIEFCTPQCEESRFSCDEVKSLISQINDAVKDGAVLRVA